MVIEFIVGCGKIISIMRTCAVPRSCLPVVALLLGPSENVCSLLGPDGSHYTGGLNARYQPDGIGKLSCINGDVYEGEWRSGHKHGHATYTWSTGSKYTGEFNHNQIHGVGRIFLASIVVYMKVNMHWIRNVVMVFCAPKKIFV